jgi:hypothetical protein
MPIEHTRERDQEWRRLQESARHALHSALDLEPQVRALPVLRLWEEPALEDPVRSWTVGLVGKTAKPTSAVVRRVTWLRSADATHLFDSLEALRKGKPIAPHLELVDAPVSLTRLRTVLAQVRKIRFSTLGVTGPMGLDGQRSGVWFSTGFNEVRFEWWMEGPRGWASLAKWHRDTERWLNECARRAARRGPMTLYPQETFVRSVRGGAGGLKVD